MNVVLLLVLASDPSSEIAASALAASAADGLEGRARVELERVSTLPADDEAVRRAYAASADAVVEVSWPDADGLRAHLHAHLRKTAPWIDRDVRFEASSAPWERGRAVGLAIAAMLPEETEAPVVPPPVAAPASPLVVDRPAPIAPAPAPRPTRFDVIAALDLATPFGSDWLAAGARLGGTFWISSRVGVRVGAGLRASSVSAASASVMRLDVGGGLVVRAFGETDRFRLVFYGELRAAREAVTRTRFDDGRQERRSHFLPYAALLGEASVGFSPHFGAVLTLGPELALGRTTLAVRDSAVASLPRISLALGAGVRWSF